MLAELAEKLGPYETYAGSPASQGRLQFDMWGVTPTARFDWAGVKARLAAHGLRNSLLLAPMPTASTAQILGNNESIEPFTSNIYTRRVLAVRTDLFVGPRRTFISLLMLFRRVSSQW